jgi:tetratricopeptide (TPR) repeat protein
MKATNRNQQKLLLLHQAEERKLNNFHWSGIYKKAAITVCLFLFATVSLLAQLTFSASSLDDYHAVLNLDFQEAKSGSTERVTADQIYVSSLAEALELLVSEDPKKFKEYEDNFEERVGKEYQLNPQDQLFLKAEINLQWAFVYLKFGHELDAALRLKNAYHYTRELRKKYPTFQSILKTSALLNVLIGSVPEKYNWILSLLNIEGSVTQGLREFDTIVASDDPMSFESRLWLSFIHGFILQQPKLGVQEIEKALEIMPDNRIALFVGTNLELKNSNSERALIFLNKLSEPGGAARLPYSSYLRAEILLHKGEYTTAIQAYANFLDNYKGQNYVKDAYYKIGLCYWLIGQKVEAMKKFEEAKAVGKDFTEADKYAAKNIEGELPSVVLTKARYFTDGGYYEQAASILNNIDEKSLATSKEKVEFHYRKARLAHKSIRVKEAKALYLKTIEMSKDEPWYFAPNAALQLAYIYLEEKDEKQAEIYFKKALSYKKHEYKNSIDSKARSGLAQLSDDK